LTVGEEIHIDAHGLTLHAEFVDEKIEKEPNHRRIRVREEHGVPRP